MIAEIAVSENASLSITFNAEFSSIIIFVNSEQPLNALDPIFVIVLGIVIEVIAVWENAPLPIAVISHGSGNVTTLSCSQERKA